jgi:hypothetical protein
MPRSLWSHRACQAGLSRWILGQGQLQDPAEQLVMITMTPMPKLTMSHLSFPQLTQTHSMIFLTLTKNPA